MRVVVLLAVLAVSALARQAAITPTTAVGHTTRATLLAQLAEDIKAGVEAPHADLIRLLDQLEADIRAEGAAAAAACAAQSAENDRVLAAFRGALQGANNEISRLEGLIGHKEGRIVALRGLIEQNNRDIATREAEVSRLEGVLNGEIAAREAAARAFSQKEADHETYLASIRAIRTAIRESRLHNRATGALTEVFATARKSAKAANAHAEHLALLELVASKAAAKAPVDDIYALLDRMEARVVSELARIRQQEQTAIHDHGVVVGNIQRVQGDLNREIAGLQQSNTDSNAEIGTLTTEIATHNTELEAARQAARDAQAGIDATLTKIQNDEAACASDRSDREEELQLIAELRQRIGQELDDQSGAGANVDLSGIGHNFACPSGAFTWGGHCYIVVEQGLEWQAARDNAISLGGDLASINTQEEQAALHEHFFLQGGSSVWIGLYRPFTQWADGTPANYVTWAGGEPNNYHPGESCTEWYTGDRPNYNDLFCTGHPRRSLVEIAPRPANAPANAVRVGNSWFFVTSENCNYVRCNEIAQSLGGRLATVNTADLATTLSQAFTLNSPYHSLYIGLHRVVAGGSFAWANGAPVTYTRWASGEPNNAGGEPSVEWYTGARDNWNDMPDNCGGCGDNRRGLVEIVG